MTTLIDSDPTFWFGIAALLLLALLFHPTAARWVQRRHACHRCGHAHPRGTRHTWRTR